MFERLRNVFTLGQGTAADRGVATAAQLSQWAKSQGWAFAFQGEPARFRLAGSAAGQAWRMESGTPARDYIHGTELRARVRTPVAPEVALLVISRALKEELEGRAYGVITDTLQTAVDDSLPQELRWLAIYEELRWPELPVAFLREFAVVGDNAGHAQRWVNAALISDLLRERERTPLQLILADGKVSLRMQTIARHLPDIQYAAALVSTAGAVALQNLPLRGPSPLDSLPLV